MAKFSKKWSVPVYLSGDNNKWLKELQVPEKYSCIVHEPSIFSIPSIVVLLDQHE